MSSYLSSLLTTTTSRYASIKQTLLASENDGETEDDTHVCRVLRNYYTEQRRNLPQWLPPDPRAPAPVVQPVYTQNNVGAGYGGLQAQDAGRPATSRLNSLWDAGKGGQGETQSLRNGNRPGAARGQTVPDRRSPFDRSTTASEPPPQARPLPSQRAGSYQPAGRSDALPLGGSSAQDRLKARFGQKSSSTTRLGDSARQNSSNSGGSYEESLAPGNYNTSSSSSSRGGERPFVAATSPWASSEQEFGGGGYGAPSAQAPRQPPGGRMGLPSGPRKGLPTGPRSMR